MITFAFDLHKAGEPTVVILSRVDDEPGGQPLKVGSLQQHRLTAKAQQLRFSWGSNRSTVGSSAMDGWPSRSCDPLDVQSIHPHADSFFAALSEAIRQASGRTVAETVKIVLTSTHLQPSLEFSNLIVDPAFPLGRLVLIAGQNSDDLAHRRYRLHKSERV